MNGNDENLYEVMKLFPEISDGGYKMFDQIEQIIKVLDKEQLEKLLIEITELQSKVVLKLKTMK